MLKALELYGFKSFADKTRFEFPAGITVVVGPNGSGKSNVVDAIKWVLGEQSAKSLRGQDMADVIFKGSGTGGRKPANVAEATIVFDNSERRLPVDAPEVHVTRRVYRSGEGEYLINRQPCRLKDIKDMFRGTGVGVDAYSLIEQGKVDRLLQASPRDRRAMFEEAAGISRFKAKKIEAQRRLERVDQNLLRLSDIVEEVENRLRSVRAQASKAKRYREYSERLQELRTHVGLTDWRKLSEQLLEIERELQHLTDQRAAQAAHAELLEAQTLEAETELGVVADGIRLRDSHIARCREQIVSFESACSQQRSRCHDLDEELVRREHEIHSLSIQARQLRQTRQAAAAEVSQAERDKGAVLERVRDLERLLAELDVHVKGKRAELETQRAEHVAQMRLAAALSNEASGHRSQLAGLSETIQRCGSRLAELETLLAANQADWDRARAAEAEVDRAAADKLKELESAQLEVAENRRVQARRQQEIAEMSGVLSGLRERMLMLEDWESRREGVGTGAKEVLALARQAASGSFAEVRGLVADVVQASVEMAPLVDVALADAAQHIVVQGEQLIRQVALGSFRPSARVGFVRLDVRGKTPNSAALELLPGVIGRADRLVETTGEFTDLVHRLLGETWFVDDLTVGLSLQAGPGKGLRFVTRAGQILDADGTIIAGARHGSAGLVSRRSELRELRQRGIVLERQIAEGQREVARLQDNIDQQDQRVRALAEAHQKLSVSLTEHHVRTRTLAEQLQQKKDLQATTDAELRAARQQHGEVAERLDAAATRLVAVEQVLSSVEGAIRSTEASVGELDARRQETMQRVSTEQIELAKNDQRCHGLRAQLEQIDRDEQQRDKSLDAARRQWESSLDRLRQAERQILRATAELAGLYLQKDREVLESRDLLKRRDERIAQRTRLNDELQSLRRSSRKIEEALHERQLAVNAVGHERQTLLERMRDDYNIDLAAQEGPLSGEQLQEREQVEEEIASLRKRIQGIGAVNLDALAELDELESRYSSLAGQFEDLKQAKESLERIIQKINADSRRLFLETLEKIRVNFQTLYRRAFGGGRADIVLEEGADVLEGGVDILATPPGKPSFSNSLLSGGEKALTAVALLLAIFQFRPSPFCVLDEVDAPFDEANIGRFIDVLKDFLSFTKFVIVTHSKKTMTSATTLYGVTMQESGVSKRVSVQFDDVTEDGHIRSEAVARQVQAEATVAEATPTDAPSTDEEAA